MEKDRIDFSQIIKVFNQEQIESNQLLRIDYTSPNNHSEVLVVRKKLAKRTTEFI